MPLGRPTAVFGAWVRIPKALLPDVDGIKADLTVENPSYHKAMQMTGGVSTLSPDKAFIVQFREDEKFLYVPRAWPGLNKLDVPVTYPEPNDWEVTWPDDQITLGPNSQQPYDQAPAYEALSAPPGRTRGRLLVLGCGKGKSLWHKEPVLTLTRGWQPIDQLRVGEAVYGSQGVPTEVLGVYRQGLRDLYRMRFTDGTSVLCDAEHLWTLDVKRGGSPRRVTLTTANLMSQSLRNKSGRRFYLPMTKPIQYSWKALSLDPYTLGALLGDGGLSQITPRFTTADQELLDRLVIPLGVSIRKTGKYDYSFVYRKSKLNPLHIELFRLGLFGTKSATKFVPSQYMKACVSQRLAVLQGLFDTDGTVTASGAVEFVTVSEQLRDAVKELSMSLGGTCTVGEKLAPRYKYKGENLVGQKAYRLLVKLPLRFVPFQLSRKVTAYQKVRRQRPEPYRALDRIDYYGVDAAVCIRVAAEDSLFLTRDYVPTHNTVISLKAGMLRNGPIAVVVDTNELLRQWKARIVEYCRIAEGDIGQVGGGVFRWKGYPIVVMLTQTLMQRDPEEWPEDFRRYPRLVIYDEIHVMAAPVFSRVVPIFYCERWGLTATPTRADKLDVVFRNHIAHVPCFTDIQQDLIPTVTWWSVPSECPDTYIFGPKGWGKRHWTHHEIINAGQQLLWMFGRALKMVGKLDRHAPRPQKLLEVLRRTRRGSLPVTISVLARNEQRNHAILEFLHDKEREGRTILVLGSRTDQLIWMHNKYLGSSGLCYGAVKLHERDKQLLGFPVVFAQQKMVSKGLDRASFDTLVYLVTDPQLCVETAVQQAVGRIQRSKKDKKPIEVHVFYDPSSELLKPSTDRLKRNMRFVLGRDLVMEKRELNI